MVQVKVCGVREPADVAALDAMGVQWLGFNFHPGSPRYIRPEAAVPLIRSLRNALPVGVFVDADPKAVAETARLTGIRYLQLHGDEDPEYVRRMPLPVIKAVSHDQLADIGFKWKSSSPSAPTPLAYLLVDTRMPAGSAPGAFGGTGRSFDWSLVAGHSLPLPFFLAGGLGPHNLRQALETCLPFAVDLNSKVEAAPGKKDLNKVRECLDIVSGFKPQRSA